MILGSRPVHRLSAVLRAALVAAGAAVLPWAPGVAFDPPSEEEPANAPVEARAGTPPAAPAEAPAELPVEVPLLGDLPFVGDLFGAPERPDDAPEFPPPVAPAPVPVPVPAPGGATSSDDSGGAPPGAAPGAPDSVEARLARVESQIEALLTEFRTLRAAPPMTGTASAGRFQNARPADPKLSPLLSGPQSPVNVMTLKTLDDGRGQLVLSSRDGAVELTAIGAGQETRWRTEIAGRLLYPQVAVSGRQVIIRDRDGDQIVCLDAETGRVVCDVTFEPDADPLVRRGYASGTTGRRRARVETAPAAPAPGAAAAAGAAPVPDAAPAPNTPLAPEAQPAPGAGVPYLWRRNGRREPVPGAAPRTLRAPGAAPAATPGLATEPPVANPLEDLRRRREALELDRARLLETLKTIEAEATRIREELRKLDPDALDGGGPDADAPAATETGAAAPPAASTPRRARRGLLR